MAKRQDILKEFVRLRQMILDERKKITARLEVLNEKVRAMGFANDIFYGPRTPTGSVRNKQSLREAVIEVLQDGPKTKQVVYDAVIATGYQFSTDDPMNSLGVVLYGRNPKFKRVGEKFAL